MELHYKQPSSNVSKSCRHLGYFKGTNGCEMCIKLCTRIFIPLDLDVSCTGFSYFNLLQLLPTETSFFRSAWIICNFFFQTTLEYLSKEQFPLAVNMVSTDFYVLPILLADLVKHNWLILPILLFEASLKCSRPWTHHITRETTLIFFCSFFCLFFTP